ncbi:MAG TPA: sugar ABC transporter permease [Thermomicrobiales bacterium]|nr:sugar ABC transporter permease [Thermomicrobiales bacterium]
MEAGIEVAPLPAPEVRARRPWEPYDTAVGRARERFAWLLILPSLLIVLVVAVYPLINTFYLSLTNKRLGSIRPVRFVGLENYQTLFSDPLWNSSLWHTIVFTIFSVGFETIIGMAIALIINSNFRGRGFVRASMLVPWAIPTVVSATMWQWMYHDVFGVVNDLLVYRLHILPSKVAWMANPATALPAIIAVDVWKTTPFMALLLLAGLQLIPGDIYEASRVDGANKWQQFWQITLPLLRPALLVALIFRTLDAFRVFDVIFVMKVYAPETMTVAVYTRQKLIDLQRLGAGSAAAVVIFVIILVLVVLYTRLVRVEET